VFTAGKVPVSGLMKLPENALKMDAPPHWIGYVGSLAMFQIPAYDPVAIVMMGFGVLFVAALAFVL
jgi:hypothetical protein